MQAGGDILLHGEVGKQRVLLEHHAEVAFFRRQVAAGVGNAAAIQVNAARIEFLESGDGAQHRGFPAAARAEEAGEHARFELEGGVDHRRAPVVLAGDTVDFEERGHRRVLRRSLGEGAGVYRSDGFRFPCGGDGAA